MLPDPKGLYLECQSDGFLASVQRPFLNPLDRTEGQQVAGAVSLGRDCELRGKRRVPRTDQWCVPCSLVFPTSHAMPSVSVNLG